MNEIHNRWERIQSQINAEASGFSEIECRIPNWEPVNYDEGLRWLQSSVDEGYYVDYRLVSNENKATIWFKIWEYGEEEPDWETVIK